MNLVKGGSQLNPRAQSVFFYYSPAQKGIKFSHSPTRKEVIINDDKFLRTSP